MARKSNGSGRWPNRQNEDEMRWCNDDQTRAPCSGRPPWMSTQPTTEGARVADVILPSGFRNDSTARTRRPTIPRRACSGPAQKTRNWALPGSTDRKTRAASPLPCHMQQTSATRPTDTVNNAGPRNTLRTAGESQSTRGRSSQGARGHAAPTNAGPRGNGPITAGPPKLCGSRRVTTRPRNKQRLGLERP